MSSDDTVTINDPGYESYNTGDFVRFTSTDTVQIELLQNGVKTHSMVASTSLYGASVPEGVLQVHSLLHGPNSQGCDCPALHHAAPSQAAVLVFRGGCTFYEKVINAQHAAKLVIVLDVSESETRPTLLDDSDSPIDVTSNTPALIMVQGSQRVQVLSTASSIRLVQHDATRLLIKGDVVENVIIQLREEVLEQ